MTRRGQSQARHCCLHWALAVARHCTGCSSPTWGWGSKSNISLLLLDATGRVKDHQHLHNPQFHGRSCSFFFFQHNHMCHHDVNRCQAVVTNWKLYGDQEPPTLTSFALSKSSLLLYTTYCYSCWHHSERCSSGEMNWMGSSFWSPDQIVPVWSHCVLHCGLCPLLSVTDDQHTYISKIILS